jgi:hypothetical protein
VDWAVAVMEAFLDLRLLIGDNLELLDWVAAVVGQLVVLHLLLALADLVQ